MRLVSGLLLASLGLAGCSYHYYPANTPASQPAPATPTEGQPAAGANCREVTQMITIDGKDVQAVGMACQQPDGSWRFN